LPHEAVDPSADEVIDQGQLRIRASPRAGDHDARQPLGGFAAG
jgi:hypothetical protein